MFKKKTYEEVAGIGYEKGLRGKKLAVFSQYIYQRGFLNDENYIGEWADRFLSGAEFTASDLNGQRILKELEASI